MNPRNDVAMVELAGAYNQIGDAGKREANLRECIAIRPEYWSHWNALGAALLDVGSYEQAREAFDKASSLAPKMLAPRQNLAALEIAQGNYEAAIKLYEALPNQGSDSSTQTNLGTAYFYTNRLEEAERAFRTAIRLEPKSALHHRNLADVLLRQQRPDEARDEYRRAAILTGEELAVNPSTRQQLKYAFYLAKAGDCERGLTAAAAVAGQMEPTASSAHTLAQIYAGCGRRQQALRSLEQALQLGFSAKLVRDEDEFAALRGDPEFDRLLASAAQR
jgi:Flp pilus assembly protein TadD